MKGQKGGECKRRSCSAPNAQWYNTSTRAYYCRACARAINEACSAPEGPVCLPPPEGEVRETKPSG